MAKFMARVLCEEKDYILALVSLSHIIRTVSNCLEG